MGRVRDLELVAQDAAAAYASVTASAEAAREDYASLQAQQEASPAPFLSLHEVLKAEVAVVEQNVQARRDKEAALLAESKRRSEAWEEEKKTLDAHLSRVTIEATVAEEAVAATKKTRKAFSERHDF